MVTFKQRSVIFILVITAILLFIILYYKPSTLDPSFVANQAQEQLARASSYRFQLSVRTVIDQQDRVVSIITGEFVHPNTYHLQGTSYDYKLNLYYINGELVFLDPADNCWKKSSTAPSLVTEAILFTTSPIADFLTANAQNFDLVASKRSESQIIYHLNTQLDKVTNPYWEIFFSDFQLDSYINYPNYLVQRLQLYGTNNQQDALLIELLLSDYNKIFNITAPKETTQEKILFITP